VGVAGDVDDARAAGGAQRRLEEPREQERPEVVHAERQLEPIARLPLDARDAGVVDEAVQGDAARDERRRRCPDRREVAEVGGEGLEGQRRTRRPRPRAQRRRRRVRLLDRSAAQEDARAAPGERRRGVQADAARGAGDQERAPLEVVGGRGHGVSVRRRRRKVKGAGTAALR